MSKACWFPFYPNDFLSSLNVNLMTTEEIGAYILLLSHAWNSGECALPNDDLALQKLGRFSGDLTRIRACFDEKNNKLYNVRLLSEWEKSKEIIKMRKKSIAKINERKSSRSSTRLSSRSSHDTHNHIHKSQSQSPSQPQSHITELRSADEATPRGGKSVDTWVAYSQAYYARYQVEPVRNAGTNTMLGKLVDKLGTSEAPMIAAYYLTHNNPFYVAKRHPPNLLLQDAEGLRTQWATGVKATTSEARNAEMKDSVVEQVKRVEALLQGGKA